MILSPSLHKTPVALRYKIAKFSAASLFFSRQLIKGYARGTLISLKIHN